MEAAGFHLTRLTEADLGQILALETLVYIQPWTEDNFRGEFSRRITVPLGLKTTAPGRPRILAAYCFFWLLAPEVHLLNLAVRPEYRRRGLGRRLLKAMLAVGRRAGAETFFLEVRLTNAEALSLYRSFGFAVAGRRPAYYENGEDAHLMTLELSSAGEPFCRTPF